MNFLDFASTVESAVRFVFFDVIATLMCYSVLMGLVFGLLVMNLGGVA